MEVADLVAKFSAEGDERVVRALDRVDAGVSRVADNSGRAGRGLGTVFQVAGGFIGAQIASSIFGWAKGLVDTQAGAEQAHVALETVVGSASEADRIFKDVQAFAAATPFQFPELLDATINMEAFGLKSTDWLQTVGDTAAAMNKPVDQVVQAILDAQTGEYERLKELGIKARVEGDKVTFSYMKNGQQITETVDKNNQAVINSTLQGIWNEKYAGAMEKQSKTFAGQMSTLKDNISLAMQSATASVFQFATKGLAFVNDIFAKGFTATIEDRFGATGAAVLDFFNSIIDGATRTGAALVAAFGEGAPIQDLVKLLPPALQGVGEKLLYVADAVGDLFSAFQSGGLRGLIQQLPQELSQVGQMLLEVGRTIVDNFVESIQNADTAGLGEAAGRIARELIVGIATWLPEHWDEVLVTLTGLILALPAAIVGLQLILIPKAAELLQGFVTGLDINWDAVLTWFALLPGRVVAQIPDLTETLWTHGDTLLAGFETGMQSRWASIRDWLDTRHEQAATIVGDLSETLLDHGVALLQGMWSGAESKWVDFTSWLEEIPGEIVTYVGYLGDILYQAGVDAVQGLINGAQDRIPGLQTVINTIKNLFGQIPALGHSPWPMMVDAGKDAMDGLIIGGQSRMRALDSMVQGAMGTFAVNASPSGSPRLQPRFSGGGHGGATTVIDLRGALIGRGAEAEIRRIVAESGATIIDRRAGTAALAGSRR